MSMFASRTKKDVKVEVAPGEFETVVIRKLSGTSLEKAAEAHRISVIQTVKVYGAELLGLAQDRSAALRARKDAEGVAPAAEAKPVAVPEPVELTPEQKEAQLKARREARYDGFDRQLTLQAGIVSWTAPEKVNPESIADLDDKIATILFREILDISLPALEEDENVKG